LVDIKARMETAQHIIHRILVEEYGAQQKGMQIYEERIRLDVKTTKDLKKIPKRYFEEKVNAVIRQNLPVKKETYDRKNVPKEVDISMVPVNVQRIRVVSVGSFDTQPCVNPHVDNTSQIGEYRLIEIKRIGKDTYRFSGTVDDYDLKNERV
jgi:misacylated tRNA(Ala) deacylase